MSTRLDLLHPILAQYKRRFSILDLGSGVNFPTLGYEIAQEFDAVVVEVEKNWKPVEPIGKQTMVLKHDFTVLDLERLSECEHFDVVLAFNFVHWFEAKWQAVTETILGMGDYVFVQIPTEADSPEAPGYSYIEHMQGYLKEQGEWLGSTVQFPGHPPRPIYLHKNGVKQLTRTNWDAPLADADIKVHSSHKYAQVALQHKTPREYRPWVPGINLWNFCRLGGVRPSKEQVREMLQGLALPPQKHGDIQPWNMILDGERLHLIDGGDSWGGDDSEGLARSIDEVERCLSL